MILGEWLTNNQLIVYKGIRIGHFVPNADEQSYCGLIHITNLTLDIEPDRPCLRCLMFLFRDGHLHFREHVPKRFR